MAETGFTTSDLTGRTYTVYRIVLFRLNLQKHGAVFQDVLAVLRKEPNHAFVKIGRPHVPSVKKIEGKLGADGTLLPSQFSGGPHQ